MKTPCAVLLLALAACSSGGGNAMTSEGATLRLTVFAPPSVAEGAETSIDVIVGNRGMGPAQNVLVDVELPPQLEVVRETHGGGVTLLRDPHRFRYTIGGLGVGSDTHIRFDVRAHFAGAAETGALDVVAWQPDVAGDRLERTTAIRLAK